MVTRREKSRNHSCARARVRWRKMVARHRVAPAAPAHRAAPQPGGRSKSPKRDKKASKKSAKSGRKSPVHRPPPPPPNLDEAAKKRAREEKEKDQLLRMRAEELLIRNEELFQAKRKIGELEKALSDSTEVTMGLRDTVASLKVQVAELQTTVGTLTQNHTAAKRETSLVQAELTAAQTLIGSTPGLMRVPVAATEAIASAVAPRPAAPTPSHDPNHDASHDELSLVDMEADPAPPSDAVPGSTAEAPSWNAIEWLSTTRVLEVVARALLAPMRELEESGRLLTDELTEIGFFRSLAAAPAARAALLSLLSEGHTLLYELTDELLDAVHRLADRRPIELVRLGEVHLRIPLRFELVIRRKCSEGRAGAFSAQGSICGKFVEGGEVSGYDGAAPGSISSGARINPRALREGIEHILGPPHPRVTETMGQEHCFSADSRVPFEASAYRMRTTSQIEWWFVLDPLEGTGGVLNVARDLGTDAALSEAGYPAEEGPMAAGEPRRPRSLNDVLVSVRNSRANFPKQLAAAGVEPLVDAEIIAARLWTGPMHVKYQAVLRSLCTGGRIEGRKSDARKHHAALCAGNKYVTTIHAINSALCKLSKIGSRTKVYRGVSCAGLPSGLWENAPTGRPGSPPPGSGYGSGGEEVEAAGGAEPAASAHMEAGFLSCTADAELALRFGTSSADEGGANGAERRLVFEMSTHTTERPAELACLSQCAEMTLDAACRRGRLLRAGTFRTGTRPSRSAPSRRSRRPRWSAHESTARASSSRCRSRCGVEAVPRSPRTSRGSSARTPSCSSRYVEIMV